MKFLKELFKRRELISIFAPKDLEDSLVIFATEFGGRFVEPTIEYSSDMLLFEFKSLAKKDDVVLALIERFKNTHRFNIGKVSISITKREG